MFNIRFCWERLSCVVIPLLKLKCQGTAQRAPPSGPYAMYLSKGFAERWVVHAEWMWVNSTNDARGQFINLSFIKCSKKLLRRVPSIVKDNI